MILKSANIGKILLVDDKYDDDIQRAVNTLVEHGLAIQYWNGKGDWPDEINNVRVIILDLDLAGVGIRGPNFYHEAAMALHKVPGPFVVIIMARDYNEDDPANFEKYCEEKYEHPLCGFIAKKGLTKKEERENPKLLKELIYDSMSEHDILNLILSWETAVEKAKDAALSDLLEKELEKTVVALIKSLCRDLGEEAATREMKNVLMQLVSRKIREVKAFEGLVKLVNKINKAQLAETTEYPSSEDLSLYNKLMFYKPGLTEGVFTGDIYKTREKHYQYAIVLTPKCILVQGKTARVLMCYGFPLNEKYFEDVEYPPYKIDPPIVKRLKSKKSTEVIAAYMKERYFGDAKLPENLFVLWNFSHEGETSAVCFDFNNVKSTEIEELQDLERVARLDSPFIDNLLAKYGSVTSQIGTMEINKNPSQLKKALIELQESANEGEKAT